VALPAQLAANAIGIASPFVQKWEAFRGSPYRCPTGHWTLGFGCTEYADGTAVSPIDPSISEATGVEMLLGQLGRSVGKIAPFLVLTMTPTAHELAAMLSCAYNIGVYGFDHSTIMREFDLGDIPASANAFLLWDKGRDLHGNLIEIDGLRNRREAERALFLTPDAAL
jgi:lysozyme